MLAFTVDVSLKDEHSVRALNPDPHLAQHLDVGQFQGDLCDGLGHQ